MSAAAVPVASSPGGLATFQRAFARALLDPAASSPGRGFAIHRNTVLGGCIDALEANYPVVAALVGRDWFREAAAGYVRASPPTDPRLMTYGADFPHYLAGLPIVAELTFLPGVAVLERLWRESHVAADAPALTASELVRVPPESLVALRLAPHPAARWYAFDTPVVSVWQAHQWGDEARCRAALEALDWREECALVTRDDGVVRIRACGRAACALLDACARAAPLGEALAVAMAALEGAGAEDPFGAAELLREVVAARALRRPVGAGERP